MEYIYFITIIISFVALLFGLIISAKGEKLYYGQYLERDFIEYIVLLQFILWCFVPIVNLILAYQFICMGYTVNKKYEEQLALDVMEKLTRLN